MNDSEKKAVMEIKAGAGRYSPFWPIFVVFLTLAVMQGFYLRSALVQRAQMKVNDEQITKVLPQARTINQMVENVGHELIALSNAKSTEAAKIISEFKIQMNAPVAPAVPPVPKK